VTARRAAPAGFERQRKLADALRGASGSIKWGADLVFSGAGKLTRKPRQQIGVLP
jgi:hypothetical protein